MHHQENAMSHNGQEVPEEGKEEMPEEGEDGVIGRALVSSEFSMMKSQKAAEKKGRIFISIDQQSQYLEAQRARYLQKEHKGVPIDKIAGQAAPVKVFLGESFVKDKEKIVEGLKKDYTKLVRLSNKCFGSENLNVDHIAERPNSRSAAFEANKREAEQLLADLRDVTYLDAQHQELIQGQS